MLEWVIEESTGLPLNKFIEQHFYGPLSLKRTFFSNTKYQLRFEENQFAATEDCLWRKKVMRGYVHDENAYVLGGYSGHAGLFGTAEEVYVLADLLRGHFLGQRADYLKPETVKTFFSRQDIVNGSTWALGWDTPSAQHSSSGRYFSTNSVGHLGFTGTSVWMDLEKDIIVVFLTNRIHPTRNNEKIKTFRPEIHDLIIEELGKTSD
jgi:CubicO group peptidase (beta-lactamase class C family)